MYYLSDKVFTESQTAFARNWYSTRNQLDGSTCKQHAEMLRLANVDERQISKNKAGV